MSAETDREALARAVAHDGPGHPYGDAYINITPKANQ